ncbi:MAG: WGR domain-containing protein [Deltaproteobacteria bacterium]
MAIRRFELVEAGSSKFWQIAQVGTDLHIAWGKIGTLGQSQIKSFGDRAAADKEALKLVKEKTGKGYLEVAAEASAPAARPAGHPSAETVATSATDASPAEPSPPKAAKTKSAAKPKGTRARSSTTWCCPPARPSARAPSTTSSPSSRPPPARGR